MVQPIEETAIAAPTYVPEPFQGLPEVFDVAEPTHRGWRVRHRSSRSRKDAPEQGEHESMAETPPVVQDPPATIPAARRAGVESRRTAPARHAMTPAPPPEPVPVEAVPVEAVPVEAEAAEAEAVAAPHVGAWAAAFSEQSGTGSEAAFSPGPAETATVEAAQTLEPEPEPELAPEPAPAPDLQPQPPRPVQPASVIKLPPLPAVASEQAPPAPEPKRAPGPAPQAAVPLPRPAPPAVPKPVAPPVLRTPEPSAPTPAGPRFPRTSSRSSATEAPASPRNPGPAIVAPPGLVTYTPDPYEPSQEGGSPTPVTVDGVLRLGYAVVLPQQRRRGGRVAVVVLLVALLGAGFFAWRQLGNKTGHSSAAAVAYRSGLGHFAATFPATPIDVTSTNRIGRSRVTIHAAADQSDRVAVESIDIAPGIPKGQLSGAARGLIHGLGQESSLTLRNQRATAFRGHAAQVAQFWAIDGTPITVLAATYSSRRIFVIMAPTGKSFAALAKSFVALP